jgi:hypothetical protein
MEIDALLAAMHPMIDVLMPIIAIMAGIGIALAVLSFVLRVLVTAIEVKQISDSISLWDRITNNLENIAERLQKRKAKDHIYPEYPALELGLERPADPDGELIAVDEYQSNGGAS